MRFGKIIVLVFFSLSTMLLINCSETVGFLTVNLQYKPLVPPVRCEADPRRADEIKVTLSCDGSVLEASFTDVEKGNLSIAEVPLGECEIVVDVLNSNGRVVASGQISSATIGRGENSDLDLQLIEQRCGPLECDTDHDQLTNEDEVALGTEPTNLDTDDDGLEDGLEVFQCCTDPLTTTNQCDELLIQRVDPEMGEPGTMVLVKASRPLIEPTIRIGGEFFMPQFVEGALAFGSVHNNAKLGDVELVLSEGTTQYKNLFAVINRPPSTTIELSLKMEENQPVMNQLVDHLFFKDTKILFGNAISNDTNDPNNTTSGRTRPLLLAVGNENNGDQDVRLIPLAVDGRAVALAVNQDRLFGLINKDGLAVLIRHFVNTQTPPTIIDLKNVDGNIEIFRDPIDLIVEPSVDSAAGDYLQVLLREWLVRFRVDVNGQLNDIQKIPLKNFSQLLGVKDKGWTFQCSGIGLAPGQGANRETRTYLACDFSLCRQSTDCVGRSYYVDFPLGCLKNPGPGCWNFHLVGGAQRSIGAPLIDLGKQQLYLLTNRGLVKESLGNEKKFISLHLPFDYQGESSASDLMILNQQYLFVADGSRVWRMDPNQKDASVGKYFMAGSNNEKVTGLALGGAGAELSIGRKDTIGLSSLVEVCLEPCPKVPE